MIKTLHRAHTVEKIKKHKTFSSDNFLSTEKPLKYLVTRAHSLSSIRFHQTLDSVQLLFVQFSFWVAETAKKDLFEIYGNTFASAF